MADLLGFAWKVIVLLLILGALAAALVYGTQVAVAVRDTALERSATDEIGSTTHDAAYSPMSLAKPLLQGLSFTGSSIDVWTVFLTLLIGIPSFMGAALGLRWLIRSAK